MNTLKHRGGSRIALFVAGVVIALFGAVAGGVGTVSAHHVELEASVDCSYVVYWTASSWNPGDLYGENNQIDVCVPGRRCRPQPAAGFGCVHSRLELVLRLVHLPLRGQPRGHHLGGCGPVGWHGVAGRARHRHGVQPR